MATFQEIKSAVEEASGVLEFDLNWLSPKLGAKLDQFFVIEEGLIYLHDLNNLVVETDRLSFSGLIEIRRSRLDFTIWIAIIDVGDRLEYALTIEPGGSWVRSLRSPFGEALSDFDFDFPETLFYFTSLRDEPLRVTFDGGDTYRSVPSPDAHGALMLFENDLLETLGLEPQVFSLSTTTSGSILIQRDMSVSVPVGPFLTVEVERIGVEAPASVSIEGTALVPFLAGERLTGSGRVDVSRNGFEGKLEIEGDTEFPIKPFFDGIVLREVQAHIGGAHTSPAMTTYGVSGRLVLNGQDSIPPSHPEQTMRHGDFDIHYSSAQAGPVPVLFETYLEEMGLATAVGLLAGNSKLVPEPLNDLLTLRSTYAYWCSSPQVIRNGVPAEVGVGVSTLFEFLSLSGYGELRVRGSGAVSGSFLLEPITIGTVLQLRGDSSGTPPGFDGPALKPGGIELIFNSAGDPYLSTAVGVLLFDRIEAANVATRIDADGLAFNFSSDAIPLVERARFDCTLLEANRFNCAAAFSLRLPNLNADLGPLGKIRVSLDVSCNLSCEVGPGDHGRAELRIAASLSGWDIVLALALDVDRLGENLFDLEKLLRGAIIERMEELLKEPVEWLKALLSGTIEAAEELLDSARELARVLEREFKVVAEDAAGVLREAGMTATRAVEVLTEGFGKAPEEAAQLLREAGYSVQEIATGLLGVLDGGAKEVFKVLRQLEVPAREIGKVLRNVSSELEKQLGNLGLNADDAAELLRGLGTATDEAGKLLQNTFKAGEKAVGDALRSAGYAAEEIAKTLGGLFGGGGGDIRIGPIRIRW